MNPPFLINLLHFYSRRNYYILKNCIVNTIQQEQNIEEQISDNVSNKGRNVSVVGSTIVQTGGIFIGLTGQITTELGTIASRFAISEGIQIAGFVLLPITCFVFKFKIGEPEEPPSVEHL